MNYFPESQDVLDFIDLTDNTATSAEDRVVQDCMPTKENGPSSNTQQIDVSPKQAWHSYVTPSKGGSILQSTIEDETANLSYTQSGSHHCARELLLRHESNFHVSCSKRNNESENQGSLQKCNENCNDLGNWKSCFYPSVTCSRTQCVVSAASTDQSALLHIAKSNSPVIGKTAGARSKLFPSGNSPGKYVSTVYAKTLIPNAKI